jgi:hypothetical protein
MTFNINILEIDDIWDNFLYFYILNQVESLVRD